MSKQILFPTDFSVCAERAFSHAAHLAVTYEARLHIVSVVDSDKEAESSPMNYLPLGADELADELDIKVDRSEREPERARDGIDTVNVTLTGSSPWRVILDYAEQNDIDLIVMGTHGRHGVDRMILGSIAEQVVRRAHCPVLTIRARDTKVDRDGPIIVPVDFSPFSTGTIAQAVELATAYGSKLHLVHVVEPIALPSVYGVDPSGMVVPDMEDRAAKALDELAARSIPNSVESQTHVLVGHAVHEIVESAEDAGARMIVIATHGLTGLRRFLMGSVTEQVVREAPCPVFTVRSFGKQLSPAVAAAMEVEEPESAA
jgi:nucleotide-binding universal stress UspA family protein